MALKVYNSLTRKKEEFVPLTQGRVLMYVCGPTVYAMSHIGHARSAVAFDVISRYLRKTYEVRYARNYTDVDDKIIAAANKEGVSSEELAERYIKAFDEDMASLGVAVPDVRPKATETIEKIIEVTRTLIDKGMAYASNGDVFYSVRRKADYGKLSGKKIDELEAGARVDVNESKQDPLDFALWKASKPGEPAWESPWGKGRPGWHIECSAMCMVHLAERIDIHGGGKDLIFPHHENEIAQSEAATGKAPYAKYWLHNGFVNIEREKMSKSLGNILNIREVLENQTGEAVRLFLLGSHYRNPIDYTQDSLKEAEAGLERFYKTVGRIAQECPAALSMKAALVAEKLALVTEAMEDDFNAAGVIGIVFGEVTRINRILDDARGAGVAPSADELAASLALFREVAAFLGVFGATPEDYAARRRAIAAVDAAYVERLIAERNSARKAREFKRSDEIRAELLAKGVVLEDTPSGTVWSVKG
ncbi:MAG: cysteine--tRNA ligase [Deltaproteobacteria bacterium]|nr:cysteine--tRNA ligase [Deltaproteobacteria bacterium]